MIYRHGNSIKAFLALVLAIALLSSVGLGSASAAGVSPSPGSGTPYTLVTLSGSGFIAFDTIGVGNITFAGSPWNTEVIQIDSCGNWNVSLRVPANGVIGPNPVVVKSTGGTVVSVAFTVTAPPITPSPSSGPPYTLVTITGSSFVPLDSIPVGGIKFDGAPWNKVAITIDGYGSWATSLRVPQTAACCGGKAVLVTTAAGTVSAATFTITSPVITITPSSGPIGTKVIVCVTNMTPDGTVLVGGITFGGAPWNTNNIDIDGTGRMCSLYLTVPTALAGAHPVVVNDGHLIATTNFTITQPTISVTPASAYKGETITVTGSGWPQHMPGSVNITFAGSAIKIATPDANGYFSVQFIVPLTAEAVNLIGASDILGNTAVTKTLTLKSAGLTLNPTSGLPGTTVTVRGVGFQPYSGVDELKFGNVNILPGGVLTSEAGNFTATFTVPGLPPGSYIVTVRIAGVALSAYYTLNESNIIPSLVDPIFPIGPSLASINDKLIIVWGYYGGDWKMYDPNDALGSTLTGLTSGSGYWIKVNGNCTLGYRNLTKDDNNKGWNLIGW
ncbi:MAG: hypothetical protein NTV59_06055 [Chloroflexi bacterium]|nr:hypothetical protein [Chloroflexota bacterium]